MSCLALRLCKDQMVLLMARLKPASSLSALQHLVTSGDATQISTYSAVAGFARYRDVGHADHVPVNTRALLHRLAVQRSSHLVIPCKSVHTSSVQSQQKALSKEVKNETFSEKAKEVTKTTYYGAVILVGLGITGVLLYTICKELFASFSPQRVYSDAVKLCCAHHRVQDMLGGDSIKSYGEETRRGRRQHVSHVTYEVEGQKGMRVSFHLKGTRRSGTVQLDARDSASGWYYRYLFVQLDQHPFDAIVVQDNRSVTDDFVEEPPSAGGLTPLFAPK